jgi:hypothetical protein
MTRDECISLILRAIDGDPEAWETIRSGESGFFVPMSDLDDTARSKANAFFRTVDIDAVLDAIDRRWAEEHPAEMNGLRHLANRLRLGEETFE